MLIITKIINPKKNAAFIYTKGSGKQGNCDYLFYTATDKVENKYIYDRWLTALILAVIIIAFNITLIIFGFLLFNEEQKSDLETIPIISNK